MKTKLFLLMTSFIISVNASAVPLHYGIATAQNKRDYQEDRYKCVAIKDSHHHQVGNFFAVYDGHGGDNVSTLLQKELCENFEHQLHKNRNEKKAFKKAFFNIEQKALRNYSDGSTAVVAYLDSRTNILHYAWAGDSRLVVCNGPATEDHKPDSLQERRRIEKAGGKIELHGVPRVNGLAVARAIGDKSIKKIGKGQVIAKPEYGQYQLTENNKFMILASDGLWDTVKNERANFLVADALAYGYSCKAAANILKNEAIKRGSSDNITVIVVQFNWS